jgi:hypothetical protein
MQLGWVARMFLAFIALWLLSVKSRSKGGNTATALATVVAACFVYSLAAALAVTAAAGRLPWW